MVSIKSSWSTTSLKSDFAICVKGSELPGNLSDKDICLEWGR